MKLPESFDRAMRDLRRAQIPVYAGNAAFFLVLSFLPLLTLLLAALQYTVFRPEDLLALLSRIMPDEVLPLFSDFLQKAYQKSGAAIISLSALTAAWSASRGIYGISKGLSAVLDVPETRSYLRLRLLCLFYMLLFVLGLVLTLLFHVFGQRLLALLTRKGLPLAGMLSFLLEHLQLYSFLLLTALFSLLYLALPDRRQRLSAVFPGALAAAALDADVYENWTDVSGFLMADPKIVQDPRPIERITYAELRELSYIGAQVLHEGTVSPVREKNIPLNIRNTNQPDHPGTMIRERFDEPELADENLITGIAGRKDFSVITITKNGMSSQAGVLRQILEVLERYGINVDYLPSGIDTVSLVVSAQKVAPCLYPMLGDLQKELKPDSIHVTDNMAIVAAVGRKMAYKPGTSGRIFAKLGENGINIRMITQGPEELNIIVGVDGSDFERAIRVLYDSFVK